MITMNNINYEAQGPPEVSPFYETLDQAQHTTTTKRALKGKPILIIIIPFIIALLCIILLSIVAVLCMEGYLIHASKGSHETSQSMEILSQSLLQILDQYASNDTSNATICQQVIGITSESVTKLINITNALSDHTNTSTSIAAVVGDIQLVLKELLILALNPLPASCEEVKLRQHNSSSGVYLLKSSNGTTYYYAYCNMGDSVLCNEGGWTRLAYLDMNDPTVNCPSGFRLYQSGGVRACGRPATSSRSCASVQFPSNGSRYSQICGRVVGYQYGTTDAMRKRSRLLHSVISQDINGSYVDGVSITRGSSRQHVWTFASGSTDTGTENGATCHCTNGNQSSFSHYFCESGNHAENNDARNILYTSDPLWDGQGCGPIEVPCCSAPGIPWFHRDYGSTTTTDYIELRVCGDQGTGNEDVPVGYYEIYVK
uniref:Fibrinogen C-terminal domain-containing protein n=1 Tax=Amphimedon queenslandica TaxID=400682 RepID=A0A1X7UAD5_AMPQE